MKALPLLVRKLLPRLTSRKINFLPTFIGKVNFLGGQVNFLSSLARGKKVFKKILDPCGTYGKVMSQGMQL